MADKAPKATRAGNVTSTQASVDSEAQEAREQEISENAAQLAKQDRFLRAQSLREEQIQRETREEATKNRLEFEQSEKEAVEEAAEVLEKEDEELAKAQAAGRE